MSAAAPARRVRAGLAVLAAGYAVFWAGGLFVYAVRGGPPGGSEWAAPAFLWLAAALAVAGAGPRERAWLAACGLLGWGAECAGVATGFPFGRYAYTAALGPAPLGAPAAMAAAWVALAGYVGRVAPPAGGRRAAYAALAAAWMTALDLVIDPLAAGPLGYWRWENGGAYHGIPAVNFAGWWAVSAALFALRPAGLPRGGGATRLAGTSIVLFFTVLAAAAGMALPAAAGVLLLAADAAAGGFPAAGFKGRARGRPRG